MYINRYIFGFSLLFLTKITRIQGETTIRPSSFLPALCLNTFFTGFVMKYYIEIYNHISLCVYARARVCKKRAATDARDLGHAAHRRDRGNRAPSVHVPSVTIAKWWRITARTRNSSHLSRARA